MADPLFALFDRLVGLPESEWQNAINIEVSNGFLQRDELENMLTAWKRKPSFKFPTQILNEPLNCLGAEETALMPPDIHGVRIEQQIGRGTSGTVYLGLQDHPTKRKVAVKLYHRSPYVDDLVHREMHALALLNHPNIATIYSVGETNTAHSYAIMEYVDGIPFCQYIWSKCDSLRDALGFFVELCKAVSFANESGIIHRDLKPSNVLVTIGPTPTVKVLDFSVSKLLNSEHEKSTTVNRVVGTPAYMSPEQADRTLAPVSTRSDVFSLGIMLYEFLSGSHPYGLTPKEDSSLIGTVRHLSSVDDIEPPSKRLARSGPKGMAWRAKQLRGELDAIAMKAKSYEPVNRYASASWLAKDIECYLNQEPTTAIMPSIPARAMKTIKRNRLASASIGSVALSLCILIGVLIHANISIRHAGIESERSTAHSLTRFASMALQNEERALAQDQLLAVSEEYRTDLWGFLQAYLDQSASQFSLDSQGISDIWLGSSVAVIGGRSGNVWTLPLEEPTKAPTLVGERLGSIRQVALDELSNQVYLLRTHDITVINGDKPGHSIPLPADLSGTLSLQTDSQGAFIQDDNYAWRLNRLDSKQPGSRWSRQRRANLDANKHNILAEGFNVIGTNNGDCRNRISLRGHTHQVVLPRGISNNTSDLVVTGDLAGNIRTWNFSTLFNFEWDVCRAIKSGWILGNKNESQFPNGSVIDIGTNERWDIGGPHSAVARMIPNGMQIFFEDPTQPTIVETQIIEWQSKAGESVSPLLTLDRQYLIYPSGSQGLYMQSLQTPNTSRTLISEGNITAIHQNSETIDTIYAIADANIWQFDLTGNSTHIGTAPQGAQFFGSSQTHLIAAEFSGTISILNLETRDHHQIEIGAGIRSLAVLENSGLAAIGMSNGTLIIVSMLDGRVEASLPVLEGAITSLSLGHDHRLRISDNESSLTWIDCSFLD